MDPNINIDIDTLTSVYINSDRSVLKKPSSACLAVTYGDDSITATEPKWENYNQHLTIENTSN